MRCRDLYWPSELDEVQWFPRHRQNRWATVSLTAANGYGWSHWCSHEAAEERAIAATSWKRYTNMQRSACICNLKVTCRWCYKPENINGKIKSLLSAGCNYVTSKDGLSEAMMHFPYCASSTVQIPKACRYLDYKNSECNTSTKIIV